ncbi:aldehyde dehydrogenase [Actinocorallia lasiicapitis]
MTEIKDYAHLIGGELRGTAEYLDSVDPATGQVWARVPRGTAQDANDAVAAAKRAFPKWSAMPAAGRAFFLRKVAEVFAANAQELAALETRDNGRIINETGKMDLPGMTYLWQNAAGECAAAVEGKSVVFGPGSMGYTRREPYGVVVGIIPWNSPISTFSAKAAFALAAGNTVVIKPAEQATVSMLRLAELLQGVLPKGVLNIVSGLGEEVGDVLVRHQDVGRVSLTGSNETAKIILRASTDHLKPVALELGGKSPNIVFADADLDKAAEGVSTKAVFTGNAGQVCVAGSRILIQRPVYDEMIEKIKARMASVRLGDPQSPETTMGPIVSKEQYDRVVGYIELGQKEGAELVYGGRHGAELVDADHAGGYWVEPTLLATTDNTLRVCQEEIFGPVAVVLPFDTYEEAIAIANASPYGLASGVWTQSLATAQRAAQDLQAGYVWVNTYRRILPGLPFGGWNASGYGHDALLENTREKSVILEL